MLLSTVLCILFILSASLGAARLIAGPLTNADNEPSGPKPRANPRPPPPVKKTRAEQMADARRENAALREQVEQLEAQLDKVTVQRDQLQAQKGPYR